MPAFELKDGSLKDVHTLRLACTCRDLAHHLDIVIDNDPKQMGYGNITSIEVNTNEHATRHWYGAEKFKAVWRILTNQPVCLGGVVVNRRDLDAIAKFIKKYNIKAK